MRKAIKRAIYVLFGILIFLWLVTFTPYDYLFKGVSATYLQGETSATIDDKAYFTTGLIRSENPRPWSQDIDPERAPSEELDSLLTATETVAFALFHRDKLVYEEYAKGYNETSRTNSFSMAKTITAMIAQMAIDAGYIEAWDQPVKSLLPDLKGEYADELTLDHLSMMQAGLNWNEHYTNAFGITAKAYYGDDITKLILDEVLVSNMPGTYFEYQSGATQLMAECVEVATGKRMNELASEWLWTPAGCSDDAEWHLDAQGQAISYCCVNSNARDFARIGHILMHKGTWNEHLFMDGPSTEDFFKPISTGYYGRSIWMDEVDGFRFSYMKGINGQFVVILPELDLVMVRLGHQVGPHTKLETLLPMIVEEMVREYAPYYETVSEAAWE